MVHNNRKETSIHLIKIGSSGNVNNSQFKKKSSR